MGGAAVPCSGTRGGAGALRPVRVSGCVRVQRAGENGTRLGVPLGVWPVAVQHGSLAPTLALLRPQAETLVNALAPVGAAWSARGAPSPRPTPEPTLPRRRPTTPAPSPQPTPPCAGAPACSGVPVAGVGVAPVVVGQGSRSQGSRGRAGTTAQAPEGRQAEEREGTGVEAGAGGPEEGEGESPTCGSQQPVCGGFALPTDISQIYNTDEQTNPEDPELSVPQLETFRQPPDAFSPFFPEEFPEYDESKYEGPARDLPAPGTSLKKVAVPGWVGRTPDGRVIPRVREEELAKQIAEWAALGAQVEEMAIRLNMRPGQIRHLYGYEIQTGKFMADMDVGGAILRMAKVVPSVAVFYAQSRMGWKTNDKDEGKEGFLNIHIHA